MKEINIRKATVDDAAAICKIYNHYVTQTIITFQVTAVLIGDMERSIQETLDADLPWIVAEQSGDVIGYAYASKWKSRCAYQFSVESTVYLSPDHLGKGLGSILLKQLLKEIRQINMHAVIAGIALPNPASVALHEKFGFRKIAQFEEVGYKFDQWIDVGYWEIIMRDQKGS